LRGKRACARKRALESALALSPCSRGVGALESSLACNLLPDVY